MKKEHCNGDEAVVLPALPAGWCWTELAQLAASEPNAITDGPFGSNLKTEHYVDAGPRVIRLQNIGDGVFRDEQAFISQDHFLKLQKHRVVPDDLVIAALGETLPRACLAPEWLGPAIVKADCIRFRPETTCVLPAYLNYALNSPGTRHRTGTIIHGVGRPRLNLGEIKALSVPLAPLNEQGRIVAKIEELFSDLDAGVSALERARASLRRYRAAVLKAAVEGKLTEEWRAKHPKTEPASKLLDRILTERRRRWEADQLAKYEAAGRTPPKGWQEKYVEPRPPDTNRLPALPEGWCWASVGQLIREGTCNGISVKGTDAPPGVPALRLSAMTDSGFNYEKRRFIPISNDLVSELMLGEIFKKARPDIQNPATLRRLIVDLIEPVKWSSMQADVKGDVYEGLLAKSAEESPKGAGQYFTPRQLIKGIVACVQPAAADTVCDPAAGTGGFLLGAYDYVVRHQGKDLDKDQKKHLRTKFVKGWELVPNTARLCIMNLYLHGVDANPCPIKSGVDSLASDPGERFSVVMTNPPFGKKSTIAIVNEVGDLEKEDAAYERQDFWTTTKNKQLNFLQHVKTLLKVNGRCAIVVPDNVLFEGGAGETVRRNLLKQCDVHTLLRLPTGIFYAQGVKANVLFFDAKPAQEKPWTSKLWVYDLRTNMHFTLKTNPLKRSDLDEFVECYRPGKRHLRKPIWDEKNSEGRWRSFDIEELLKRDKVNLDIFWLKDKSLEESDDLPDPDVLAQEIADDLQTALEQFSAIAEKLKG